MSRVMPFALRVKRLIVRHGTGMDGPVLKGQSWFVDPEHCCFTCQVADVTTAGLRNSHDSHLPGHSENSGPTDRKMGYWVGSMNELIELLMIQHNQKSPEDLL
jgi:hypothetical protein